MSENIGYYRMPTVSNEKIAFISENDLWEVPITGGNASRLTTSQGAISFPKFSPDGKWIAFTSTDEGSSDVYIMPSIGGPIKRLTYFAGDNHVLGWSLDGEFIIFSSNAKAPGIVRLFYLYKVHFKGGEAISIPVGLAQFIDYHKDGYTVIGRFQEDNAKWKRYHGGTAGDILIDNEGKGIFKSLISLKGNIVLPHFYKDRILFLSDHEGISNLYSVNLHGLDLQKLTSHTDFYVRFFSIFNDNVVYQAGGNIYLKNLTNSSPTSKQVSITIPSMRMQRARKFVDPSTYLEDFVLSRDNSHLLTVIRGKIFNFGFWEGGVNQLGKNQGVRYKLAVPLSEDKVVVFSDESGDYKIETYSMKDYLRLESFDFEVGIPYFSQASPDGNYLALTNHNFEIIIVDLIKKSFKVVTKDRFGPILHFSWSCDSKWLTYSLNESRFLSSVYLYSLEKNEEYRISPIEFEDFNPVFDPLGRYIYFISFREFNSAIDNQYFKHMFPKGCRICAINLNKGINPPFIPHPKPLKSKRPIPNTKGEDQSITKIEIDLDEIERRITMLPLEDSIYNKIEASEDRLFYTTRPALTLSEMEIGLGTSKIPYSLKAFKLENLESVTVEAKIFSFKLADDKKTLVLKTDQGLRIVPFDQEQKLGLPMPPEEDPSKSPPSRKNGVVDLTRVKVLVEPELEWKQMLFETWRLMRENYWEPTFQGLDWNAIFKKYESLIPKITTREEFSDLVWEMIGETGTSHSYEVGGDYRKIPLYKQGFLGGEFKFDVSKKGYIITKILRGDNWNLNISSPLDTPGANITEGDVILSINGLSGSEDLPIGELLINLGGEYADLRILKNQSNEILLATIKVLISESELRYRDWVNNNGKLVSELSENRLGYIHIPDMSRKGVTEFYRTFRKEITKEGGLIIDIRFNGGGNTSQLFLELLSSAQKRTGYVWTRHSKELDSYFMYSTEGSIVAITNEFAGSDGDIFSHNFKLLKIGTLIGKRTWGGVVGIWPKVQLVDGSIVTQPEYSYWFKDVGWGVENYGTDPDIEVEYLPQDYAKNKDPQLLKAVAIALENLKNLQIKAPKSPLE